MFTCQHPGCGFCTANTSLLVAHHKVRHRGNAVLFWDAANIITVCKACHDGPIKAAEAAFGG
jgi:5-methylcytosine-specific restriction endonuclease McrA